MCVCVLSVLLLLLSGCFVLALAVIVVNAAVLPYGHVCVCVSILSPSASLCFVLFNFVLAVVSCSCLPLRPTVRLSLPCHQRVFINVIIPHFYVHVIYYTQYWSLICMHNLRTCCDSPGLDTDGKTPYTIFKGLALPIDNFVCECSVCPMSGVYFLAPL